MAPDSAPAGWLDMMNMHLLNRSGLAAIAAATAFISTPALAQDAAPVVVNSAPIVADTPLPSEPATPPSTASDTLAPTVETAAPVAATRRPVRATRPATIAARSPAPVRASARPAPVAPVAAPVAATTAPVELPADPAMVAPIPEQPVAPVAPVETATSNDMLPIAGAAGLGILALAGAGFAMRRRRRDDDVVAEQAMVEPDYVAAMPLAIAPIPSSAFAWGDKAPVATPATAPTGLSWIEAAKRGPTPDNPSASLKKRLARAAFFDQRERAVAAGTAVPVSPMAGLPKRMVRDEQPTRRSAPVMGMSFNRRFQPA